MKAVRSTLRLPLISFVTLAILSGCATQRQVKKIVAESNAAMVSPYLNKAGAPQGPGWKEAIAHMDRLIEAQSDQPVLVNHLRVRQAMLLTVHIQDQLALYRWKLVVDTHLTTERDRALHKRSDALVWWYKRATDHNPLSTNDQVKAKDYITTMDESIAGLTTYDLKIYMSTLRAQMALKVHNSTPTQGPDAPDKQKTANALAGDLKVYIDSFSETDRNWVESNRTALASADILFNSITDMRNRIWLDEMIAAYHQEAEDKFGITDANGKVTSLEIDVPWTPAWVTNYASFK